MPLGDVITLQRGFDLPTQDRRPGRVPIVSSAGITGTHMEARVKGPGVVTGRYGTIGEVFYITQDFWPLNTTLYVKDFKGNDPLFISYLLRTIDYGAHNDKSSVPGVNRNHLHTVRIMRPPLPEQRAIAHILGTLDDKIALNRRMNATLEAMARALFRSWFVDFDPVRAKAEGQQPVGMDAATAALFPDGFEESELGEIPRGWRVVKLAEVAQMVKGVSYSSTDLRASDTALVTLKSVARGGGYQEGGLKPYTGQFKPQQIVNPGEIVVAHTDLTQGAEVLGRPARVGTDAPYSKLVASLDLVIVRPRDSTTSTEYLYELLWHDRFQEHAYGYSNGTTVLHLSARAIPEFAFVLPPAVLVQRFTDAARTIFQMIDGHLMQSQVLTDVRHALLPKLLSGEIRVGEAERQVEARV